MARNMGALTQNPDIPMARSTTIDISSLDRNRGALTLARGLTVCPRHTLKARRYWDPVRLWTRGAFHSQEITMQWPLRTVDVWRMTQTRAYKLQDRFLLHRCGVLIQPLLAEHHQEEEPAEGRIHPNNSPNPLRTNSSKSSQPYTLSQRKQLRVEEKSYLKEVKRSIAEGRVPQIKLQQNNSADIIQYKAQFLNALKLAALSIVPNADIDVKNPSIMQEIMKEVQRQFVIEKPLPEGMVAGFLQRLYKRNRAVYHRHWTVHGDQNKPDDCTPAAWLQLVDYWKSREGSKECERNKANASANDATV